jgi:K+-transporting ATPase ATPase C chain
MIHIKKLAKLSLFFLVIVVVTGIIYPLSSVLLSQALFKWRSSGELQSLDGRVVGAKYLAQDFSKYRGVLFQSRDSANDYKFSGGSNLSIKGKEWRDDTEKRKEELIALYGEAKLPSDAYTESASGFDPDISVDFARLQAHTIAKNTTLNYQELSNLIEKEKRGDRVNVLLLNLEVIKRSRAVGKSIV